MATAQVQSIRAGRLARQQAVPKAGSIISPHRIEVASTLSPQRLAALLAEADQGNPEAYFTLAEEMEEKEPHYSSVLFTRKLGVAGCPVLIEAADDGSDAKEIATAVEELAHKPEFEGLLLDCMDAVAKGIALIEIIYDRQPDRWMPLRYEFRPQRYFVFDEDTMTVPLLRTDAGDPVPLDPYKWIVHQPKLRSGIPLRSGLARTAAVAYAAKRWTVADWLAFMDIYGIPVRVGKYPAHHADKKTALLRAIQRIGSDAAAVIPAEMDVEILDTNGGSSSGGVLFERSATYWDKQTSKLVLGQTMTTDDGSSLAQSKTHERVRFDILAADARAVAATISRDLVRPFVDLNFGPQKVYPTLTLLAEEGEDMKAFMETVKVYVELGGRVQASEVRDRLGLMEPEPGAELLQPRQQPAAPGTPGKDGPVPDTHGKADKGAPAEDDDEIDSDGKSSEMNAEQRAPSAEPYDATDEYLAEQLGEWRSLVDENIGRLIQELQEAPDYETARAKLAELERDHGNVLDVGALVVSLARGMLALRGVGDASDEVKP